MRYLDIAVAMLVGMAAIAGIIGWSPAPGDAAAGRLRTRSALRDLLVAFVDREGMPWLASAQLPDICSAAAASSNSTVTLSAEIGQGSCANPPAGANLVRMNFTLASRGVTLLAWSGAAG